MCGSQVRIRNKYLGDNIHIYTHAHKTRNAILNVWGCRTSDLVRRFWRFWGRTNGCTYLVYVCWFVSFVGWFSFLLDKERNNPPSHIPTFTHNHPQSADCYAYLCALRDVFLRNRSSDDQNASICILAIVESECRHMFASLTNN